jgi:hypothetical protein
MAKKIQSRKHAHRSPHRRLFLFPRGISHFVLTILFVSNVMALTFAILLSHFYIGDSLSYFAYLKEASKLTALAQSAKAQKVSSQLVGRAECWIVDNDLLDPVDSEELNSESDCYLITDHGLRIRLVTLNPSETLMSGTRISLNDAAAEIIMKSDTEGSVQLTSLNDVNILDVPEEETLGDQKLAVILVYYQNQVPWPFLGNWRASRVARDMKKWFDEVSYGRVNLDYDVYGWFKIPQDYDCGYSETNNQNIINHIDHRIDFSQYQRLLIFRPAPPLYLFTGDGCTFAGYSSIGEVQLQSDEGPISVSVAHMNSFSLFVHSIALRGALHELGHGFGLYHANGYDCGLETLSSLPNQCVGRSYGDPFDIMGVSGGLFPPSSAMPHFNTNHKDRLNWLSDNEVVEVTSNGIYEISPLALPMDRDDAPKALKISLTQTINGNVIPRTMYIDYRQPIDYDDDLVEPERTYNGALITMSQISYLNGSYLLDATPADDSFHNAAIMVGEHLTDPVTNITITPLNTTPERAVIQISGFE